MKRKLAKIMSTALCTVLTGALLVSVSGVQALAEESADAGTDDEILSAVESILPSSSDDAEGKEQTVYVITDASGKPTKTIVSTWLKNPDGDKTIKDNAKLTDIEVTKGSAAFTVKGDEISFDTQGEDVYYQGVSDEKLPLSVTVSYKLDGKSVTAEKLAGASGHLEMTFSYKNNTSEKREVNGERVTLYQPFAVVSGVVLDQDKASNVEVEGGKVISTGDQYAVVGMAFPGLKESLGLDEDTAEELNIPEEVTIEADVTDFSLLTTMTVVDNSVFQSLDLDDVSTLDDLEDSINQLASASQQLVSGTGSLTSGTATFSENMSKLNDGISELSKGAGDLNTGINTLATNLGTVSESLGQLNMSAGDLQTALGGVKTNLDTLAGSAKTLSDSMNGISVAANTASDANTTLSDISTSLSGAKITVDSNLANELASLKNIEGITTDQIGYIDAAIAAVNSISTTNSAIDTATTNISGIATAQATVAQLPESFESLKKGAGDLSNGLAQLDSGLGEILTGNEGKNMAALVGGIGELNSAGTKLATGLAELQTGSQKLAEGASTTSSGSQQLVSGAQALLDGARQLQSGMAQFNAEGISKLTSLFEDDAEGLIARLKALQEYSEEYTEFGGKSDMDSTVRFIIRTDSIGEE